jgi:hypothetical protein
MYLIQKKKNRSTKEKNLSKADIKQLNEAQEAVRKLQEEEDDFSFKKVSSLKSNGSQESNFLTKKLFSAQNDRYGSAALDDSKSNIMNGLE